MFHLRLVVVVFLVFTPWIVASFVVQPSPVGRRTKPRPTTRTLEWPLVPQIGVVGRDSWSSLHMSWFDKAFHGGGSANQEELDDIWNTQQAILAARRGGETKEHLKAKYKEPRKYFEVKATTTSSSNSRPDDGMYVQDDKKKKKTTAARSGGGTFKMPWDKN